MNYSKKLALFLGFFAIGCTSLNEAVTRPDTERLRLIDKSENLGLFTDAVFGGKSSFSSVGDHSVSYTFTCFDEEYAILFSTVSKAEGSLATRLVKLMKGRQNLTSNKIDKINEGLEGAELVGPVGLRCAFDELDDAAEVTINMATKNTVTYSYDFSNKKYALLKSDFE